MGGAVRGGYRPGGGRRVLLRAATGRRAGRRTAARGAGGGALPGYRRVRGGRVPRIGARCARAGAGRQPPRHAARGARLSRAVRRIACFVGRSRCCHRRRFRLAGGAESLCRRACSACSWLYGVLQDAQPVDARRRAPRSTSSTAPRCCWPATCSKPTSPETRSTSPCSPPSCCCFPPSMEPPSGAFGMRGRPTRQTPARWTARPPRGARPA